MYKYADEVRQIAKDIQERYLGDPDRTYMTGFSFGGRGVLDLAFMQPDFWAALWAVDPVGVPIGNTHNRPLWISFGEVSRPLEERYINTFSLVPADGEMRENFVYQDLGQDHLKTANLSYMEKRIYSWLLSKRL